ncbi:hypothetical protein D3C75_1008130 [compost metagenome]
MFGLGHAQAGRRLIEKLLGHSAGEAQAAIAAFVVAGLAQLGRRRAHAVVGGAQGQLEILDIQLQQGFATGHPVARVFVPGDHLAANAKTQVALSAGRHHAGIRGFMLGRSLHHARQHQARLRCVGDAGVGLAVAAAQCQQHG